MKPTRLFDLLSYQATQFPDLDIFVSKINEEWVGIKTSDFIQKVNQLSLSLLNYGIKKDDKIALICENRVEWNIIDFAVQQIGAVFVAIYPNISDQDYEFIFNDAEIKLAFVSTDTLYKRLINLKEGITSLQDVFTINQYPNLPNYQMLFNLKDNISFDLDAIKNTINVNDLASLLYTSGTTGKPKGVMLTHKNLMADVMSSEYSFPVKAHQRALSFLPACHAYERVFQYVYMYKGLSIYFATSLDTIGVDIKQVKPHIFSAVPRVLEKIFDKIMAVGNDLTGIKKSLFFWAVSVGENYTIENRSWLYNIKLNVARKLIFSKWKDALGGDIVGIASGSAALQERLLTLYLAAGIPIYEGYGLTEAGPCLAVNCFKRGMHIGTVGVPLINIDIKLAEDGEILAKGDNVMQGYYKNAAATAEVLKDGWLHTGDIGTWIDNKYLKIIDRKKEMFKTSGGKYIVPQALESKMLESPYIEQIMVIGEGQKFPAALVVPNYDNLIAWAKANSLPIVNLPKADFLKQTLIFDKINLEIGIKNQFFGNFEQIKKIRIITNEFSIESGELTPTLKMKRKIITEKYSNFINDLYQS